MTRLATPPQSGRLGTTGLADNRADLATLLPPATAAHAGEEFAVTDGSSGEAPAAGKPAALATLRESNERLRESEQRFRGAFEHAPIGMALVSLDGRWRRVNASLCRMIGYTEDELRASTFQAITHPEDLDADLALVRELVSGQLHSYRLAKRYFHKDGRVVWVQICASVVRDDSGRPLYFVSQIQDVTQERLNAMLEADQRAVLENVAQDRPLLEALNRVAEMVERQLEGTWASVLLLDEGEIQLIGPNLPAYLAGALRPQLYGLVAGLSQRLAEQGREVGAGGAPTDERAGDAAEGSSGMEPPALPPLVSDLASDAVWLGPAAAAAAAAMAQSVRACWAVPIQSGDGTPLGLLAAFCRHSRPPTAADGRMLDTAARLATVAVEHHQTTRQLAHLVQHDPLTGLPNRLCFEDRFQQAMALARRSGKRVALFVLDVDRFKHINDTFGHDAGDSLLQQFAQRLRGQLRETDTLARMGGDEFMLVLPELSNREGATTVAEKLVRCLREPFAIAGQELTVTSSMGIVLFPDDGEDSAALQRLADEQMYATKRRGRNGYAIAPPPAPTG